MKSQETSLQVL